MIWVFRRQRRFLRCEVRTQSDGPGYEIALAYPDGTAKVERFTSERDLITRWSELEQLLRQDGWTRHDPHAERALV